MQAEDVRTSKPPATSPPARTEDSSTAKRVVPQTPLPRAKQSAQPPAASGVSAVAPVAPRIVRPACAMPDAPARVVSLAPAQISDQKRTESSGKDVVLTVEVGADGAVIGATVKESAGDVTLDFAALNPVRHSSYTPAERACTPVPGTADVTVSY